MSEKQTREGPQAARGPVRSDAESGIKKYRPSEFMRARRPELFSDSTAVTEKKLSREVLEYHLETLTNRKQEIQFEYFCRCLAEREVCPNLLPQTGPTGGGDSQVDTQTYPVAEAISLRWYEGEGTEAGKERWAFAFSAKKEWKAKITTDVRKIVATDRNYKLVYFFSNQFVPDKKRAKCEDALTKEYGVEVRILDRSWIVERIFKNNRIDLAIESLGLTQFQSQSRKVIGPHDFERETELLDLDSQIDDPSRYTGLEYQLAEDALRSAILARGLERPRSEVDGRFARAERIAAKVGNRRQLLRIAYAKAWTSFWWFDDVEELDRLYDEAEALAIPTDDAADMELLVNLWQSLTSAGIEAHVRKLSERTNTLRVDLDRLARDPERPNNGLQARTLRLLLDLNEALREKNQRAIDAALAGFKKVFRAAKSLGRFPVEQLANLVREFGRITADSAVYDELFELVVDLVARRKSEGVAGRTLLQRGYQKLQAGKRYEAIGLLGRAQEKLSKEEYLPDLVSALIGCGLAYEQAGLLWAARTNLLAAAADASAEFWKHGRLGLQAMRCLRRLVWLELQLGRVPWVLSFTAAADSLELHIKVKQLTANSLREEREIQDLVLGLLLLRTPLLALKELEYLPDVLERFGYAHARGALLYALGHESRLREEGWIPEDQNDESLRRFFFEWADQPAREDLPKQPDLAAGDVVALHSVVLGCEVIATAHNDLRSVQLAETLLGALESLLATSLTERVMPYRQRLKLTVQPENHSAEPVTYRVGKVAGEPVIEICYDSKRIPLTRRERTKFREWLWKLLVEVLQAILTIGDPQEYFENIMGQERALSRALDFADVPITVRNLLGDEPRFRIVDWQEKSLFRAYALSRSREWDNRAKGEQNEGTETDLQFGSGEPPVELLDKDDLKHRDRRVISLIDIPLWDRAGWLATGFAWAEAPEAPLLFVLGFTDANAGKAIFEGLRTNVGNIDANDSLRVCIITGIDRENPSSYKVVVGANAKVIMEKNYGTAKEFVSISRINRMNPADSRNLGHFLDRLKSAGRYIVAPGYHTGESRMAAMFPELGIGKYELHVRPAWQISENDPDVCALEPDDDPIIPHGVTEPPVARALKRVSAWATR